jgi:hypothetical protein
MSFFFFSEAPKCITHHVLCQILQVRAWILLDSTVSACLVATSHLCILSLNFSDLGHSINFFCYRVIRVVLVLLTSLESENKKNKILHLGQIFSLALLHSLVTSLGYPNPS